MGNVTAGGHDPLSYAREIVPCNCGDPPATRLGRACLWHAGAQPAIRALIDVGYIPLANPTTQQAWELLEQAVEHHNSLWPGGASRPVVVTANAFVAAMKDARKTRL